MPDKAKLVNLRAKGARWVESCATCAHAGLSGPWGVCSHPGHQYRHRKHGTRPGPACVAMVCDDWERRSPDIRGVYATLLLEK
jgi:hypothetical protein